MSHAENIRSCSVNGAGTALGSENRPQNPSEVAMAMSRLYNARNTMDLLVSEAHEKLSVLKDDTQKESPEPVRDFPTPRSSPFTRELHGLAAGWEGQITHLRQLLDSLVV